MDKTERIYAEIASSPTALTEAQIVAATALDKLTARAELARLSATGRARNCKRVRGEIGWYDVGIHRRRPRTIVAVHSGGQAGVDTAGLRVAQTLSIETGGWAPRGWLREDPATGANVAAPWLADFGVVEFRADGPPSERYRARTIANVHDTDGTLLLTSRDNSPGCLLTRIESQRQRKALVVIEFERHADTWRPKPHGLQIATVADILVAAGVRVLNVAGTRESKAPGIEAAAESWLTHLFAALGYPEPKAT